MTWTLLGVTGEVVGLDEPPFVMARQPQLFGVGPVSEGNSQTPALSAGDRRGRSRLSGRPLTMPMHILADGPADLWQQIERLSRLLDPTRGDCVLIVERPDGERREIVFNYTAGLTPQIEWSGSAEATLELVARCPDPFWHSVSPEQSTLTLPVTGTGVAALSWDAAVPWDAAAPWDGWSPTDSGGVVVVDIDNRGSAPSWPEWRFRGSLTGVTCTNLTNGRVWSWSVAEFTTLGPTDYVDVVCHELSRSVRVQGADVWRGLQPDRQDLWPLEVGVNSVLIEVTGADGTAEGSLSWRPRWLTC